MINWLYKICVDIVWAVSFVFEGCLSDNLLSTETLLSIGGPETLAVAVTHAGGHPTAYAYDCENRLVSVTPVSPSSGDLAIVNEYDHMNRRVRKTVRRHDGMGWSDQERHSFVWDGWNIVLERIDVGGSTAHVIEYYWGEDFSGTEQGAGGVGGLLSVSCDGKFYVPIYGGNGNIMGYVDESGTLVAKFVYDPYGNVVLLEGDLPLPLKDGPPVDISGLHGSDFSFGFLTKYHDREVGLIAYQLRSYSPALGRWLNRDPIEEDGGVNLYGFCLNNVFLYYDSKGESFEDFSNFCAREGDLYAYWPHPENGTSKESRTSLEEKSHRRPPKGSVLAHERGHAEVFVTLTKPRFENYISSYLSKKALTSEEKDEVKALFAKAQHDTIGESGKRANVNTVLWFQANGFSVTRRKSGGSLRPNAEDPYEFIKR